MTCLPPRMDSRATEDGGPGNRNKVVQVDVGVLAGKIGAVHCLHGKIYLPMNTCPIR
jgi:hypothetical protein